MRGRGPQICACSDLPASILANSNDNYPRRLASPLRSCQSGKSTHCQVDGFPLSGKTSSTSEALSAGFTSTHTFAILPLGSMRKVLRLAMLTGSEHPAIRRPPRPCGRGRRAVGRSGYPWCRTAGGWRSCQR